MENKFNGMEVGTEDIRDITTHRWKDRKSVV